MSQSGARVQVLHCHVVRRAVEVGRELGAHNQLRHRRKLGHGGGRQKGSEVVAQSPPANETKCTSRCGAIATE